MSVPFFVRTGFDILFLFGTLTSPGDVPFITRTVKSHVLLGAVQAYLVGSRARGVGWRVGGSPTGVLVRVLVLYSLGPVDSFCFLSFGTLFPPGIFRCVLVPFFIVRTAWGISSVFFIRIFIHTYYIIVHIYRSAFNNTTIFSYST